MKRSATRRAAPAAKKKRAPHSSARKATAIAARKPGRARLDVSSRRLQLLALGLAAFTEQAYDQVSIDEVARAAGISKGLLYHYFPSKKEFYVATLRAAAAQLLDATAADPSLPPLERLSRGLEAFLAYVEQHARGYAALLRGGVGADPQVFEILESTRTRFQQRLLEGLPSELSSASLRLLSRGWVALVETATLEWVEKRELSRAQLQALLAQSLLAILGAHAVVPVMAAKRKR